MKENKKQKSGAPPPHGSAQNRAAGCEFARPRRPMRGTGGLPCGVSCLEPPFGDLLWDIDPPFLSSLVFFSAFGRLFSLYTWPFWSVVNYCSLLSIWKASNLWIFQKISFRLGSSKLFACIKTLSLANDLLLKKVAICEWLFGSHQQSWEQSFLLIFYGGERVNLESQISRQITLQSQPIMWSPCLAPITPSSSQIVCILYLFWNNNAVR